MAKKLRRDAVIDGRSARMYARLTKADMDGYRQLARNISEHIKPGDRVLEVAPGAGYTIIELAKMGNYSITGMDLSQAFTEIGKENAREAGVNAEFRQGNVSDMPFEDGAFDFIVNRAAFKNFQHPVDALSEMFRVLRKGGTVLIEDMNPKASYGAIREYVSKMRLGPLGRLLNRLIFHFGLRRTAHSRDELEEFVRQTKFSSHEIKEHPLDYELWLHK